MKRDNNASTQTHDQIIKPLKRDSLFDCLDDAQEGARRWLEEFEDPDNELVWGPCKMR